MSLRESVFSTIEESIKEGEGKEKQKKERGWREHLIMIQIVAAQIEFVLGVREALH